jgi:hypothetical protein
VLSVELRQPRTAELRTATEYEELVGHVSRTLREARSQ